MKTRTAERLAEVLDEFISEAVADISIDAGNVQGLDDKIDNALSEFEPETEANNIRGLNSEIEDVINNMDLEVEADNVDGLANAIDERVNQLLHHEFDWETVFARLFMAPSMQTALEQAVKKALLGLVQQFLNVPTAQPVTPPVTPPAPPAPPTVRFNGEGVITEEFRRELERGA